MTRRRGLLVVIAPLALGLAGCGGTRGRRRPIQLSDIAKTDIDVVAEFHLAATLGDLRLLMNKLYRRNPDQWRRTGKTSAEAVVARLFAAPSRPEFTDLGGARGAGAVKLAFSDDYRGDRVLAFVGGLASMVMAAYGNRHEFFLMDSLDPQKLYNSARNIEIAAWKLANDHDARGQFYLLSNSMDEGVANISFERLMGKIIGRQDMIAELIADRSSRTFRHVVQGMASAVFLPI